MVMAVKTAYKKVIRDLWKRKGVFIAITILFTIGIMSYVATISAYNNLFKSYNHVYDTLSFADYFVFTSFTPSSVAPDFSDIKGIDRVEKRLVIDSSVELGGDIFRARLIGVDTDHQLTVNKLKIYEGKNSHELDARECLLEKRFADAHNISTGDRIIVSIYGNELSMKVAGTFASPEYLIISPSREEILVSPAQFAVLVLPIETLTQAMPASLFYQVEGTLVNNYCFIFEPDANEKEVINRIKEKLEQFNIIDDYTAEDQPSNKGLKLDLEGYREMAYALPFLFLVIAGFSVYSTLSRLITAQRREIGVMKALGTPSSTLLRIYTGYSLFIALISFVLGSVLGQLSSQSMTSIYASELGIPLVKTAVYPSSFIVAFIIAVLTGFISGWIPSRRAVKLQPAQAIRTDPALQTHAFRSTALERLLYRLTPGYSLRFALRNLLRVRHRTFYTFLGIVFSFILVIASWSFVDSMNWMLNIQINKLERWDMMAVFPNMIPDEVVDELENFTGVTRVETYAQVPVRIPNGEEEINTVLIGIPENAELVKLDITSGLPQEEGLKQNKVYLNRYLMNRLDLEKDDTFQVKVGDRKRNLVVAGETRAFLGAPLYTSLKQAGKVAPSQVPNLIYLKLDESILSNEKKLDEIRDYLVKDAGAVYVEERQNILKTWKDLMSFFYAFFGLLVAFAGAIAFVSTYNAVSLNITEREREIATMLTLGESKSRILRIIFIEIILVFILSLPFGIAAGVGTGTALMNAFQSELFSMVFFMYPLSYVVVSLILFLIVLVSGLTAIRFVSRINLAQATKVVE